MSQQPTRPLHSRPPGGPVPPPDRRPTGSAPPQSAPEQPAAPSATASQAEVPPSAARQPRPDAGKVRDGLQQLGFALLFIGQTLLFGLAWLIYQLSRGIMALSKPASRPGGGTAKTVRSKRRRFTAPAPAGSPSAVWAKRRRQRRQRRKGLVDEPTAARLAPASVSTASTVNPAGTASPNKPGSTAKPINAASGQASPAASRPQQTPRRRDRHLHRALVHRADRALSRRLDSPPHRPRADGRFASR